MNFLQKNALKKMSFYFTLMLLLSMSSCDQRESLFNGDNLDGWTIYGTEKWYADNGELVCESGPDAAYGYLGTNKHYKDFILTLEFKQEANGNSGVFIRSTVEGTTVSGWQVEVAQKRESEEADATGGIYESYGRGWLIKPEMEKDKNLKVGDWNKMKIKVEGATVTTWLNGVEMVNFTDDKIGAGEGGIALQIHSGGGIKVRWRDLYIEEILK